MNVGKLNLAHAQLTVTAAAAGVKPGRIPALEDFLPDIHVDDEKPRTFEDWAAVLMPLAGG